MAYTGYGPGLLIFLPTRSRTFTRTLLGPSSPGGQKHRNYGTNWDLTAR